MIELGIGIFIGIVLTVLVLNNNPKLAAKLKSVANLIENTIEKATGKDI